jgi:hypothetical protein
MEICRMQTAYKEECHVADSQKPSKDPYELLPHTDFYLELFFNLQ